MNIFRQLPKELPEELIETLCQGEGVRIERIVSQGHSSDEGFWYDQSEHEWVIVLKGEAVLEFASPARELSMSAGDYALIKPHEKHRVKWTTPDTDTVWLAVFFG